MTPHPGATMNVTKAVLVFSVGVNVFCGFTLYRQQTKNIPELMRLSRANGAIDAALYLAHMQGGRTRQVVALYALAEDMKTDTAWSDFIEGRSGYNSPFPPDSLIEERK